MSERGTRVKPERDHCREDFSRPSVLNQTLDALLWRIVCIMAAAAIVFILWKAF